MAKQKSSAQIFVGDGTGGMVPLEDHRLEAAAWCVEQEVPKDQADSWMEYLRDECHRRGWGLNSFGQLDAVENSGSATVHTGTPGQSPEIVIVWERTRTGPLKLQVRPSGTPPMAQQELKTFLDRVNDRHKGGAKETFYRRGFLQYEGLPWRGEFWLEDRIRLGPPTRHAGWLIAPQVLVVDALVSAVGVHGAVSEIATRINEIALFLTIVMRSYVHRGTSNHVWTINTDKTPPEPEVRQQDYWETSNPSEMPQPGLCPSVPMRKISRLSPYTYAISANISEQWLADDVGELWNRFVQLSPERRTQFLNAANAYQAALSLWRSHPTAALAFKVVACEALKPLGKRYDNLNVYDVVEALLGADCANALRGLKFAPQRIRSAHVHRAELLESEAARRLMMLSTFHDPTCDEDYRQASTVLHATMVEWLHRGGALSPVRRKKQKPSRGHKSP